MSLFILDPVTGGNALITLPRERIRQREMIRVINHRHRHRQGGLRDN